MLKELTAEKALPGPGTLGTGLPGSGLPDRLVAKQERPPGVPGGSPRTGFFEKHIYLYESILLIFLNFCHTHTQTWFANQHSSPTATEEILICRDMVTGYAQLHFRWCVL